VQRLRVAAVGHIEWVQFARVAHVPRAGEVVHAQGSFEEPAGGGAVAAVQLARLAGESLLITALGEDELGERSRSRLKELGVVVAAVTRAAPTRRAVTLLDEAGERTITTLGERLQPQIADAELPWSRLQEMDAIYFTAGDAGALRAARAAKVLVATPRARDAIGHGIPLDALVLSEDDALERREAARARAEAELVLTTRGERGGAWRTRDGDSGTWDAPPPPAPAADSYGCGDSFAAGFAYGRAAGRGVQDAISLAARCGAVCATGNGPYEHQLTAQEAAA
jgi:ribokinase